MIIYDDMGEVYGHSLAKRVLEIAVLGHYSVLFIGSRSASHMLACRIPGIMPASSEKRLFRALHYTCSDTTLAEEAHRAQNGVLFMEEVPKFRHGLLSQMRETLRDLPAKPLLVGSMTLCPCTNRGSLPACVCSDKTALEYRSQLAGYKDMFDLSFPLLMEPLQVPAPLEESSASIRKRLTSAREFAKERGDSSSVEETNVTLRIARTIADLELSATVHSHHLDNARSLTQHDFLEKASGKETTPATSPHQGFVRNT